MSTSHLLRELLKNEMCHSFTLMVAYGYKASYVFRWFLYESPSFFFLPLLYGIVGRLSVSVLFVVLLYRTWAFAPGLSLPYPSSRLMTPQMPRPAPRAMTSVWSTWIAELKNSIQKPGASPRTRRRLPAQPRPPFKMLLKAAVFPWASSGLVRELVNWIREF